MTTEMDGGQRKLRVTTNGHPFSRYKLCVTAPDKSRVCKKFEMQKFGEYYTSTVYWAESYPNKGAGAYTVRWMKRGALLGRALGFHVK
jgi:hypothetical protein